MRSIATNAEQKFPVLMIAKEARHIVLFFNENCGVMLNAGNYYNNKLHYTESWNIEAFDKFTGSITLSND